MSRARRLAPIALYLLLAMPPARASLESTMAVHMLLQIPLLVAVGIGLCRRLPAEWQDRALACIGGPVPPTLLALFVLNYWMLPRALDAALAMPLAEAAKFFTLPALAGVPLALSWRRLTFVGRGFVWTNFASMLAVFGWLYLAAPQRVCNRYLLNEQEVAGRMMIVLAAALFALWLASLFVGPGRATGSKANCVDEP